MHKYASLCNKIIPMEELETEQEIFKVFLRGCPTYTMKLRIKLEIGEKKRNWMKSHMYLCAPFLRTRLDGQWWWWDRIKGSLTLGGMSNRSNLPVEARLLTQLKNFTGQSRSDWVGQSKIVPAGWGFDQRNGDLNVKIRIDVSSNFIQINMWHYLLFLCITCFACLVQ